MKSLAIIFDLDDTLYSEHQFVLSGYQAVAKLIGPQPTIDVLEFLNSLPSTAAAFDELLRVLPEVSLTISTLVECYRSHSPTLILPDESSEILRYFADRSIPMGLLTDGRSITQRNKIASLGIEHYFQSIVISEEFGSAKPTPANYQWFEKQLKATEFVYVADNPKKDFVAANQLGWTTICLLDSGRNVHSQRIEVADSYRPQFSVRSLLELPTVLGLS